MRASTVVATALLCLVSPAAGAYLLLGASWNVDDGPIVYYIDPAGSEDISDGSDVQAVRNAFRSWACVEGSRLRTLEGSEDGPGVLDLGDGFNTVFWDEDGSSGAGLGPGTLGVTIGDAPMSPDMPIIRFNTDIVMNGIDHTWSTDSDGSGVDAESVLVHEAGHWFGLNHPCTDQAEMDCLGPDQSVMTPALPSGAVIRTPFEDDENGLREMYAQDEDDESTCDGPFRQGEPCLCNDECVGGLKCTAGPNQDVAVCTPNCGTSAALCPSGFACVLAARPEGQDQADGACVQVEGENAPPAAVCERDSDCAEGLCLASSIVGRRICQLSCDSESDCPDDYACTEGLCTGGGATDGISCPVVEPDADMQPPACTSLAVGTDTPWWSLSLVALLPLWVRRRRR